MDNVVYMGSQQDLVCANIWVDNVVYMVSQQALVYANIWVDNMVYMGVVKTNGQKSTWNKEQKIDLQENKNKKAILWSCRLQPVRRPFNNKDLYTIYIMNFNFQILSLSGLSYNNYHALSTN